MARMTGTKGHSGGAREGAGRPAEMLRIGRRFTIKANETVLVHEFCQDGIEAGKLATVHLEGRGRNRQIVLLYEDGSGVRIGLYS